MNLTANDKFWLVVGAAVNLAWFFMAGGFAGTAAMAANLDEDA